METMWSRPIPVSRAPWLRIGDSVLGVASTVLPALRRLLQRWQAAQRRAAELRALRELSPSVLRDIGASPEWIQEAQRWREQCEANRDPYLRSL